MKKTIIVLFCIFLAIIISLYAYYLNSQNILNSVKKFNYQFEQYFDKEFFGAEVATILNKAIDNNDRYEIPKTDKGKYIEDNAYCLKILIKFKDVDDFFEMESINSKGIENFVKNFNMSTFKITDYKYNEKTKRIGKIVIEEIKIGNI